MSDDLALGRSRTTRWSAATNHGPGLLLVFLIAAAASYLSEQLPLLPAMLLALAIGMTFAGLADEPRYAAGIRMSAQAVLRLGVAFLGVRVSLGEIASLGWQVPAIVVASIGLSFPLGYGLARSIGLDSKTSVMAAGGVAICGASAVLAIAAALPGGRDDRQPAVVVAAVTIAGTIAMLLYPLLGGLLGFAPRVNAIFLGASIHEVAQVVAAGSLLPAGVAGIAVTVKLLRVACLAPVILSLRLMLPSEASAARSPILPLFVLAFIAFAALSSFGLLPIFVVDGLSVVSRWCLLAAMAAVGTRAAPRHLRQVSLRVLGAIALQTLLLAVIVVALLRILPGVFPN